MKRVCVLAKRLWIVLSVLLVACQTFEVGVERTATTDPAAIALATENARLVTVVATLSASPLSTPLPPSIAPETLRIVFAEDNTLWLWTPQQGLVSLISDEQASDPIISEDGTVIAYRKSIGEHREELWAINVDGSNNRQLISAEELAALDPSVPGVGLFDIQWVPGKHTLAYSTVQLIDAPPLPYDDWRLFDTDTGAQRTLFEPGSAGYISYAPNGKQLALSTTSTISVMNNDGSARRDVLTYGPISTYSEWRYYAGPQWSADSTSFYVAIPPAHSQEEPDQDKSLWMFSLQDSSLISFTLKTAMPLYSLVTFSPDLNYAAYIGAIRQDDQLLTGLIIHDLRENHATLYHPSANGYAVWSPDSQHFVFTIGPEHEEYIGQIGGGFTPLGDVENASLRQWVNERLFIFVSGESGRWEVRLGQIDGSSNLLFTRTSPYEPWDFNISR